MENVQSLDGTAIAYSRAGSGPALVLVHGANCDHTAWDAVSQFLMPHVTINALDRRGRGASGNITPYAVQREIEDITAVLNALDEPAYLLGHSSGAILALDVARQAEQLRGLILYEPPLFVDTQRPRPPRGLPERLDALVAAGDLDMAAHTFLRQAVGISDAELDALRASPSLWARFTAFAPTTPYDARIAEEYMLIPSQLRTLQASTLLLLGERSPGWMRAGMEALAEALPAGRITVLPNQEHSAIFTAPNLFAHVVLQFLQAT